MRAMQMKGYGGPEQLQLVELAQPLPQSGTVLVRVHCASVNPVDWKMRSGGPLLCAPDRDSWQALTDFAFGRDTPA